MRLRPFFSYFGAKWRLASRYPEPTHDTIIEPFAGSAGYSLLYPDRNVILVEKDPDIAALWRFLVSSSRDDIMSLPLIEPDQELDDLEMPCRGARVLVGFWLARSGTAPAKRPNAWMKKHRDGYPGCFWGERSRRRIADQVQAISHWEIVEGSYEDGPNWRATWFVDPPYRVAGKSYKYGAGEIDYSRLGAWCMKRCGQIIVCENDGETWLPFQRFETTSGTRKRSVEAVWTR